MKTVTRWVRERVLPGLVAPVRFKGSVTPDPVVRVVGLHGSGTGIGKSARLCMLALEQCGYRAFATDISRHFGVKSDLPYPKGVAEGAPAINILHLNPPMLLRGVMASGLRAFRNAFNVGYWAWELQDIPLEWRRAIPYLDAIMVPSEFSRAPIQRHADIPVSTVSHPLYLDPTLAQCLAARAPRFDRFTVCFTFSFSSSMERKNPLGAIEAFGKAFGGSNDVELVLKTSGGAKYPGERQHVLAAIGSAPNIRMIDEVWDDRQVLELIQRSHVYLSLHRSEGFGLTIAEAILLGTPCIATGWSGNVEYMNHPAAYPVPYRLTDVSDPHPAFRNLDAQWADADTDSAAQMLRSIAGDFEAARVRAAHLMAHSRAIMAEKSYAVALNSFGVSLEDADGSRGDGPARAPSTQNT